MLTYNSLLLISCTPPRSPFSFRVQVLDECHHATGRHSVSKVLAHYHKSEKRTQVGGWWW